MLNEQIHQNYMTKVMRNKVEEKGPNL